MLPYCVDVECRAFVSVSVSVEECDIHSYEVMYRMDGCDVTKGRDYERGRIGFQGDWGD